MPVEGRGPELGAVRKGGRDLTTDGSLRGSAGSVRKLQNVLHAKAKEEPDRRFHALVDKVWRQDFLLEAWRMVRRNGGAAGVDGVTVADVEAYGVERWVGGTVAGPEGWRLRAESGASGAHPEEAAGEVPSPGHTVPEGSGCADVGDAGAGADIRGGPAAGAVCIPAGTKARRTRCSGSVGCCTGATTKWSMRTSPTTSVRYRMPS